MNVKQRLEKKYSVFSGRRFMRIRTTIDDETFVHDIVTRINSADIELTTADAKALALIIVTGAEAKFSPQHDTHLARVNGKMVHVDHYMIKCLREMKYEL